MRNHIVTFILLTLLYIILYFGVIGGAIWSVVEFILYLVKDNPFNWWSIKLLGIGILLMIASFAVFPLSIIRKQ